MSAWLFITACGVLSYTGFCRLAHTDQTTLICIRVVIWALTVSAVSCIAAVLVWGYAPGWPSAVLSACMATLQVISSRLWHEGVPAPYKIQIPRWWRRS